MVPGASLWKMVSEGDDLFQEHDLSRVVSISRLEGGRGEWLVVSSVGAVLVVLVLPVLVRFVLGGLLVLGVVLVVVGGRWVTLRPGVLLGWGGGASVLGRAFQRGDTLRASSG